LEGLNLTLWTRGLQDVPKVPRGDYEKKKLAELEKEIICLPTTEEVWHGARELARKSRSAGHTFPSADLIIASCALCHKVALEHCEAHFDFIMDIYKK